MDLDGVESCGHSALGGIGEVRLDGADLSKCQLAGERSLVVGRDGRRSQEMAAAKVGRALRAAVDKLDAGDAAGRADSGGKQSEVGDMFIGVEVEAVAPDPAGGISSGCLDDDCPGARPDPAGVMLDDRRGNSSGSYADFLGHFADETDHRRHGQAVSELHVFDGDGREKVGHVNSSSKAWVWSGKSAAGSSAAGRRCDSGVCFSGQRQKPPAKQHAAQFLPPPPAFLAPRRVNFETTAKTP